MTTTGFELDQEQIRDLVFRSQSERDRDRAKPETLTAMRFGGGAPIVTEWRCRYPGPKSNAAPCRVMIPVDSEAVESLAMFNAELVRRNDPERPPIETHEVMVCEAHQRLIADHKATVMPGIRARQMTEMRDAIQKLKASDDPRNEKALIEIVTKLHHPDVEGLLLTLEEKLGGKNKRRSL